MKRKLLFFGLMATTSIVLIVHLQSCKRDSLKDVTSTNQNDSLSVQVFDALNIASNVNESEIILNMLDKTSLKSAKHLGKKTVLDHLTILDKEKKNTYFYVVNYEGGGYSVISADKRVMPILGYNDNGYFKLDSLPLGMELWFESSASSIKNLRSKKSKQSAAVASKWSALSCDQALAERSPIKSTQVDRCSGSTTGNGSSGDNPWSYVVNIGPLTTTLWSQDCGYNTYCPNLSDGSCGHAYTGCSTTAIAQIMAYWKYPSKYNWSAMSTYSSDATAKLMGDIFPNVIDSYNAGGSACSNDYNITHTLFNFGYSSASLAGYVNGINENGGFDYAAIRSSIKAKRPVILGGYNSYVNILGLASFPTGSGHTWVCDGYFEGLYTDGYTTTMSVMYYMNWGWGGSYNGWYNGDSFHGYNYFRDVIYNIHP